MKVIHTIKKKRLRKIKKSGFLNPNTPFFQDDADMRAYGRPRKEFQNAVSLKYICTIPKSKISSWARTGFIDEIKFSIKPDYVLEFELPKGFFSFVREHYYTSPVYIKKNFGIDQFYKLKGKKKQKIWKEYLLSNKVFLNSRSLNGIKVPELWIHAKVPIAKIKITPFSDLVKKVKDKSP